MEHLNKFDRFNEKEEKWIQDAIKSPGALRKKLNKGKDEKITMKDINDKIKELDKKDKDPKKKGSQLSKSDAKLKKQLVLAKTLKKLKESHSETDNYMFFANLENICSMVTKILEMDKHEIDEMLTEGHDWATDHISSAKESIGHVHDWLMTHDPKNVEYHQEDPDFVSKFDEYSEPVSEGFFVDKKKMKEDISRDYRKIAQSIRNIEDSFGNHKLKPFRPGWRDSVKNMIKNFKTKWYNKLEDMGAIEAAPIEVDVIEKVKLLNDQVKKYDKL